MVATSHFAQPSKLKARRLRAYAAQMDRRSNTEKQNRSEGDHGMECVGKRGTLILPMKRPARRANMGLKTWEVGVCQT